VTDLGGGCASGGSARATCARAGNLDFTHRLRAAAPATPALLLLGTTRLDLACGPCTVVPLPLVALDAGATDAVGNASLRMPLPANPSLVGALLYEQWLVASAGACPLLQSSLSNALSVQIQ